MSESPLKVWLEEDGRLLRLRLSRPKANIIDAAMIGALSGALDEHLGSPKLRGVILDAEGPHFSFGASVQEHLPDLCADMIHQMHSLVAQILNCEVPFLAALRGQCLGGALEVVGAGHFIFAAPGAMLGQPEIKLGVFAPPASCILPERIGQSQAEDLLFSGRTITADEAHKMGLVNFVAENPEEAAKEYFRTHLLPHSGMTLRLAVRASRITMKERIESRLDEVKKLYLEDLMSTHDAVEGLNAFLEERRPVWKDR
ncbi:MAG: cyclohexa-1,5-dienecarbonyl-CoA hydratase [Thermoleophilia bacterium]